MIRRIEIVWSNRSCAMPLVGPDPCFLFDHKLAEKPYIALEDKTHMTRNQYLRLNDGLVCGHLHPVMTGPLILCLEVGSQIRRPRPDSPLQKAKKLSGL